MASITTRLLRVRPVRRLHTSLHHYSSSSDHGTPQPQPEPERQSESTSESTQYQSKSSFSSYFSDVKSSLQREPFAQNRLRRPQSFTNPTAPPQTTPPPSQSASLEEIRRNLSEFRHPSAPPPPPSASTGQYVSFQELFKRNATPKPGDSAVQPSLSSLSERMRQLRTADSLNQNGTARKPVDSTFLARLKDNLNSPTTIGGSDSVSFPSLGFKKDNVGDSSGPMRTGFMKSYNRPELGKKLQMLRPEKRKGNWFSLQELNDRLARLREIEEKESRMKMGSPVQDLRNSLQMLQSSEIEKKKVRTMQKLDALSNLGGTPSYMLYPPNEDLLEQYFHPDNMSSAEKMKLELKKVRDEFKMSESDCGSARVQVAQLTTKIKHLSTVLTKKDKHSRKGLQAMVQKRKKLLKYLRRTDWDSYSLVLSKLGLRDNPDIKA